MEVPPTLDTSPFAIETCRRPKLRKSSRKSKSRHTPKNPNLKIFGQAMSEPGALDGLRVLD